MKLSKFRVALQLHRIRGELNEVLQQLKALPHGVIENIDHREYVDIEYYSLTPPQPNLRQQFEAALPPDRYRLVRISRQYVNKDTTNSNTTSTLLLSHQHQKNSFKIFGKNKVTAPMMRS